MVIYCFMLIYNYNQQHQETLRALMQDHDTSTAEFKNLEEQHIRLVHENDECLKKMNAKQQKIEVLEHESDTLKQEKETLRQQNESLKQQNETMQKRVTTVPDEVVYVYIV